MERLQIAPNDVVMNAQEAADFLGAHVETVRRLARRGDIPSFKVGKDWRFRKEALSQWADSHHLRNCPANILIVDDEEPIHKLIRRMLAPEGYQIHASSKGEGGLAIVSTIKPDLVLLDLQMPGMNGPEFLLELRKIFPVLPVVIITGYPDSDLMSKALEATGNGPILLVPKPFTKEQLIQSVRMILKGAIEKK
ncbi:MAG TPA: response regulator [bacterium]|nr:response regulator [bacterium]